MGVTFGYMLSDAAGFNCFTVKAGALTAGLARLAAAILRSIL